MPAGHAGGTDYKASAGGQQSRDSFEFRRQEDNELAPEVKLARAKLLTMFQDIAGRPMGASISNQSALRLQAHGWFFGKSDFEVWCEMAGYSPQIVRKRAKKAYEEGVYWDSWRAAPGKGAGYAYRKAKREAAKLRLG